MKVLDRDTFVAWTTEAREQSLTRDEAVAKLLFRIADFFDAPDEEPEEPS